MPATTEAIAGGGGRTTGLFRPARRTPRAVSTAPEPGLKRAHFIGGRLPALLLFPQLGILALFFFIPSLSAFTQAFFLSDPFGNGMQFVGLDNFRALLGSDEYANSIRVTIWFTVAQSLVTFTVAAAFAFATDHVLRGRAWYRSVLLIPYAIAPVIAGILWAFLLNPTIGPISHALHGLGVAWDPTTNPNDAMALIILAASWKHLCYDYIFLVTALLAVPRSMHEAAAIDGAGPIRRFFTIGLPLISPTIFFLFSMNLIYGLFETFAIVDAVTRGGPAASTNILVYKAYQDGFVHMDLGSSSAQSVLLMAAALVLTALQFRHFERKVTYGG